MSKACMNVSNLTFLSLSGSLLFIMQWFGGEFQCCCIELSAEHGKAGWEGSSAAA